MCNAFSGVSCVYPVIFETGQPSPGLLLPGYLPAGICSRVIPLPPPPLPRHLLPGHPPPPPPDVCLLDICLLDTPRNMIRPRYQIFYTQIRREKENVRGQRSGEDVIVSVIYQGKASCGFHVMKNEKLIQFFSCI